MPRGKRRIAAAESEEGSTNKRSELSVTTRHVRFQEDRTTPLTRRSCERDCSPSSRRDKKGDNDDHRKDVTTLYEDEIEDFSSSPVYASVSSPSAPPPAPPSQKSAKRPRLYLAEGGSTTPIVTCSSVSDSKITRRADLPVSKTQLGTFGKSVKSTGSVPSTTIAIMASSATSYLSPLLMDAPTLTSLKEHKQCITLDIDDEKTVGAARDSNTVKEVSVPDLSTERTTATIPDEMEVPSAQSQHPPWMDNYKDGVQHVSLDNKASGIAITPTIPSTAQQVPQQAPLVQPASNVIITPSAPATLSTIQRSTSADSTSSNHTPPLTQPSQPSPPVSTIPSLQPPVVSSTEILLSRITAESVTAILLNLYTRILSIQGGTESNMVNTWNTLVYLQQSYFGAVPLQVGDPTSHSAASPTTRLRFPNLEFAERKSSVHEVMHAIHMLIQRISFSNKQNPSTTRGAVHVAATRLILSMLGRHASGLGDARIVIIENA